MTKKSAGLLMYRRRGEELEVFLAHPGGPFWSKKDAWTIPKGEFEENESPLEAAKREFREETGFDAQGEFIELGEITQPGGKRVLAWAFEGDCDPSRLVSNTCWIEWPQNSGRQLEIPEIDRGAWFSIPGARKKIFRGQETLLDRLVSRIQQKSAN
ncbi:MAG TPA: NUDIX domain-containing protein [Bryobacteraceae bacterium]|nr:NUDIX domain-containing protein [Bryobacteraceae bacterium]